MHQINTPQRRPRRKRRHHKLLLGGFVASDILVNLLKFRSYWRGA